MKRGAEQQLTKDGRDEEEDEDAPTKPLFGGFGGFGGFGAAPATTVPSSTPETSVPKASPFGAFGGFGGSAPASSSSPFGVSSNSSFQTAGASKTSQMFGASLASASASLSSTKSASFAPTHSTSQLFGTNPSQAVPQTKLSAPTSSSSTAKDSTVDYFMSLRGLNHSLLTTLERAIAEDPFVELPLDQVSKAYAEHRKGIEKDLGLNTTSSPKALEATSKPSFTFSSTPPSAVPPPPMPVFTLPAPPAGGFFPLKPASDAKAAEPKAVPSNTEQKPMFSFGGNTGSNSFPTPLFGSSSVTFGASKADDMPKAPPAPPNFGSFVGFGQPAQTKKAEDAEKNKEVVTNAEKPTVPEKASLYPFSALGPPLTSTISAPAATKPPVPSFFSFSSTPTATPAQTPPAPAPMEKRPSLSSFGFGSSTGGKSWSFGTPTPTTGSLGNPVGFSFGSPPKEKKDSETVCAAPPPTAGTTAILEAVAASSNSSEPPAMSIASVIDGSVGGTREPSVAFPSVAVPSANAEDGGSATPTAASDEGDQTGEGEENEDTLAKARAKLYRFKDGAWADMGTGHFKLKAHKETGTKRVLMRNEGPGKVMLNFRVHSAMEPALGAKPTVIKFTGHEEGQPVSFQVRLKNAEEAQSMLKQMSNLAKEA
ncbi:hypothetical protein FRB96_002685 [Tulasnella sp. 330]|nr:hypothetical protein FRB96_002685 [Tulasnella sp. 330]KAG8884397.1 hypothetical protein FRB97_004406 [Tulasnella sp. 331]